MIPLIQELHAIVEALRCNRPACCCLGSACFPVHILRLSVLALSHHISVINVLSHKIKWLGNKFHILICNFRQILSKFLKSLFRIFSKKYRIIEPCHIPGPVVHGLVEAKQRLSCCLDILWGVSSRICHTAGWCIAYLDRSAGILPEINNCLPMGTERIVGDLKYILIRKL